MTDCRESELLLSILLSTSLASMAVSSPQLANGCWSDGDNEEKSDSEEEEDDGVSEGEKREDEEEEGWMVEEEKRLVEAGMALCKESAVEEGSAAWHCDGSGSELRKLNSSDWICCCWCCCCCCCSAGMKVFMLKSATGTERTSVPVLCGERREEPPTVRSRMLSVVFLREWREEKELNKLSV